jgi:hypothetical protein
MLKRSNNPLDYYSSEIARGSILFGYTILSNWRKISNSRPEGDLRQSTWSDCDKENLANDVLCAKINKLRNILGKSTAMAEKKQVELKDFMASVNKKNKHHNGKAIQFAFVNKKRK